MLRPGLLLSSVLSIASLCGGQTVPEPQFEGSLTVPKYEGGYVLDWDAPTYSKVTLYGPNTKSVYSLPITAERTLYGAWAADADGAAARAYRDSQRRGKVDLLEVSGKVTRTVDTGSYIPTHVTFAWDHTIWTLGIVYDNGAKDEEFKVLRHYARTGEQLGEALPWSQIAGENNRYTALQLIEGGRSLFSANDRIGFIAQVNRGRSKWIEVSFAGTLLGQYDLGSYGSTEPGFLPTAMTSSGQVCARVEQYRRFEGYAVLDRSTGMWRKVAGYPRGTLVGTDGDDLVFSQLDGGWTVLHRVASAALTVEKVGLQ